LQIIEGASNEVGIPPYLLPTVGHDAAMFARKGIPSNVILVRNTNSSHNPDERVEMEDFMSALKLLALPDRSLDRGILCRVWIAQR
jgi:N-carbamoyl-L-amino-acid hydrolase